MVPVVQQLLCVVWLPVDSGQSEAALETTRQQLIRELIATEETVTMPHITANGIEIYVESHGDPAGTPLLMVRGLGSQIIHWPQAMIDRLVPLPE